METLNPKTFDIAEMFAGISFPEEEVEVYTNPGIAYQFSKLQEDSLAALTEGDEDAQKEILARREDLMEQSANFRYRIHLKGTFQDNLEAIRAIAEKEFPPEKSAPQIPGFPAKPEYTDSFYRHLRNLTWELLIDRIVAPNGSEVVKPDLEFVSTLAEKLPPSEADRVSRTIRKFSDDTNSGFESIAQERDFLSKAS